MGPGLRRDDHEERVSVLVAPIKLADVKDLALMPALSAIKSI